MAQDMQLIVMHAAKSMMGNICRSFLTAGKPLTAGMPLYIYCGGIGGAGNSKGAGAWINVECLPAI